MKDYYATLGVAKNSSDDEIKQAYRRLASKHHPDRGGDTARFQEIQEAYATLSDPEQRAAYDNPRPRFHTNFSNTGPFDFNDIFQAFGVNLGPNAGGRRSHVTPRMQLWLGLRDVIQGGPRIIAVQSDQGVSNIEIDVPPGIRDGDSIRYPQMAPGGKDLVITYRIRPDQRFQQDGVNLIMDHPVPVWDLILGGEARILDALDNQIVLTIPPRTQPNSLLRLKGKGIPPRRLPGDNPHAQPGDLLVKMVATIPRDIDPEIIAAIEQARHR